MPTHWPIGASNRYCVVEMTAAGRLAISKKQPALWEIEVQAAFLIGFIFDVIYSNYTILHQVICSLLFLFNLMVRMERLELSHLAALEPKSSASTNFATSAWNGALYARGRQIAKQPVAGCAGMKKNTRTNVQVSDWVPRLMVVVCVSPLAHPVANSFPNPWLRFVPTVFPASRYVLRFRLSVFPAVGVKHNPVALRKRR